MLPFILICVGVLALGVALQALLPNGFSLTGGTVGGGAVTAVAEIEASDTVQINEVMTSNDPPLPRRGGPHAGLGGGAQRLRRGGGTGGLDAGARGRGEPHVHFPPSARWPRASACWCSPIPTYEDGADGYHAPFSLKAAGDTLMLFNPAGVAVEAINIPALGKNAVYRRVEGGWEVSSQFTPAWRTHRRTTGR